MANRQVLFLVLSLGLCVAAVASLLLLVGAPVRAQGLTRYVAPTGFDAGVCTSPSSPCRTVQYAVDRATSGDVIKVATGVYHDTNNYGGLVQVVYVDKTVTIRGGYAAPDFADPPDPEAYPTTLDAGGKGRAVYVSGDISVTVEGLDITGGDATGLGGGPNGTDAGGGVYVAMATVTISRNQIFSNTTRNSGGGLILSNTHAVLVSNTVRSNTAAGGGGLYLLGGTAILKGNTISSNTVEFSGGGLRLDNCDATLDANVISANTAAHDDGGGLHARDCDLAISRNTIAFNHAGRGGGLRLDGGSAALCENRISGNAAGGGGGVYIFGLKTARLHGNVILSNTGTSGGGVYLLTGNNNASVTANTIQGNLADKGGGLYVQQSGGLLSNNTINGNTAQSSGGGLWLDSSPATLSWNTISRNSAGWGGGLYVGSRSQATLNRNTIISNTAQERGGGVFVQVNTIIQAFEGNTVSGNTAQDGGGLYGACGVAAVDGNRFSRNTAHGNGGGLYLSECYSSLTNNIVTDNQAEVQGSGLYIILCSPTMLHTTIARNSGGDGSGVHYVGEAYRNLRLKNTILLGHVVGITGTTGDLGFSVVNLEATLWGTGTWANDTDWAVTGDLVTGTVNIWDDPGFVDPEAGDYHIGPGSAALDQGVDAKVVRDIDRQPRPYLAPDLGADEYWPPGVLYRIYLPLLVR